MTGLAWLLLLQAAAPPPDVVVMAERDRRVKLDIRADRKTGVRSCRFKRRSGDAGFDARMCDISLACTAGATQAKVLQDCAKPAIEAFMKERAARRATAYSAGAPSMR